MRADANEFVPGAAHQTTTTPADLAGQQDSAHVVHRANTGGEHRSSTEAAEINNDGPPAQQQSRPALDDPETAESSSTSVSTNSSLTSSDRWSVTGNHGSSPASSAPDSTGSSPDRHRVDDEGVEELKEVLVRTLCSQAVASPMSGVAIKESRLGRDLFRRRRQSNVAPDEIEEAQHDGDSEGELESDVEARGQLPIDSRAVKFQEQLHRFGESGPGSLAAAMSGKMPGSQRTDDSPVSDTPRPRQRSYGSAPDTPKSRLESFRRDTEQGSELKEWLAKAGKTPDIADTANSHEPNEPTAPYPQPPQPPGHDSTNAPAHSEQKSHDWKVQYNMKNKAIRCFGPLHHENIRPTTVHVPYYECRNCELQVCNACRRQVDFKWTHDGTWGCPWSP